MNTRNVCSCWIRRNNLATIYSLLSGHIYLTATAREIFLMETEQVDRLIKGFGCLAIQELQICSENVKLKWFRIANRFFSSVNKIIKINITVRVKLEILKPSRIRWRGGPAVIELSFYLNSPVIGASILIPQLISIRQSYTFFIVHILIESLTSKVLSSWI